MKIKNLIAVAALLMGSTSAFAQTVDEDARSVNDVLYRLETLADESKIATVVGVNPMAADEDVVMLLIPDEVEGEHGIYSVVAFDAGWESYAKDVTTITESLGINAANFGTNDLSNDFTALQALKNLVITDNEAGDALVGFPDFYDETIVEILDISTSTNITAVPANTFAGGALQSIALPETITEIGSMAFDGCADLSTINFPDALATIGTFAFRGTASLTAADLTSTDITIISNLAFYESGLTSFTVPKAVTTIGRRAFEGCANLQTITFEAESECTTIDEYAFCKTAISAIELPEAIKILNTYVFAYTQLTEFTLKAGDPTNIAFVDASAFEGCAKLKTFNFVGADMWTIGDNMDDEAFLGCIPFVTINAPQDFIDAWRGAYTMEAPTNCKFVAKETLVVDGTIAINNGFAKWFHNLKPIAIDAEKYKAFSVYVDNGAKKKDGTAYFQGLKKVNGRYYIPAWTHVILQPLDATAEEVEYQDMTIYGLPDNSVLIDEIFTFDQDYTLADFQTGGTFAYNVWGYGNYDPTMFVYRLTNNNGIGFRLFQGVTMKGGEDDGTVDTCADAQFFIQSIRQPDAAGRLNVVWLDEDGNEIEGATAIQGVEKAAAEDGAIYNLQGVRVNAVKKGLYIQNGKKFIVK